MPLRKRTSSVLNGDDHEPMNGAETTGHDDELSLDEQAEAAEAEPAEADALAAAARARTRALRLRRQAEAAAAKAAAAESAAAVSAAAPVAAAPSTVAVPAEVEATNPVEVDAPITDDAEVIDAEDIDAEDIDAEGIHADDAEPVRRRRFALRRPSVKIVAAAVVILVSLGLFGASGYMIWHHRQIAVEQQRSAEFAAAARQGVVTLMSLDFNHADDDVKRILDNTTGDFKKDFESQAPEFVKVAKESKVTTVATVNATAVDNMTRDTATVLVAVNTNVSNAASKEQQPRSWRLKVDVARDGGQIKLAKVEFVP